MSSWQRHTDSSTDLSFSCRTRLNEGAVARDDMETSVYYVKDALDANVTYAAGPQVRTVDEREEEEEEGEMWGEDDEVDTPDIGGWSGCDPPHTLQ